MSLKTFEMLDAVPSLDALEALLLGEPWEGAVDELAQRHAAPDDAVRQHAESEVATLREAVLDARTRLSPEHSHPELQALKAQAYGPAAREPEALRALLARISTLRSALPIRRHERLIGQLETAVGQRFTGSNVGTGYSNRARRARDLFTSFAGQTHIEGAETDRHGNAAGTGYDLGRDGAFEGHSVHVLHLYQSEGFDFSLPTRAFERKGFHVDRRTDPGSPEALRAWLVEARQLWLISDAKPRLEDGHLAVLQEFWQRGGALYIWGDNQPYYVDANRALRVLFGKALEMTGNTPGGKVVHELGAAGTGFLPHLITTGLVHLFEGITVASLDEAACRAEGLSPLLYGSAGNLITVVREPTPTSGALAIDTAFTRLYCQWDDAGSARYVCNAACFLAAMTLPDEAPAEERADAKSDASAEQDALAYDPRGAFEGVCDLTGERPSTWLVLSVAELGDALENTSDLVLDDPLSAGARNATVFSDRLYAEGMASWIVEQGVDPFTRQPVKGFLPLVDLSTPRNLRAFTLELGKWLLGGKHLPTAARLLFFGIVDEMLDERRGTARLEAWRYLYRQCLATFTSTPEFSEIGRRLPLLDAMTAYFSPVTDPMVQTRRSFQSVGVIARTLLREGRSSRAQLALIARRALVKTVVSSAIAAEKARPGTLHPTIEGLVYHSFHGMPTLHGGRLVGQRPEFVRDVDAAQRRIERDLGEPLLTPAQLTVVLHALLSLDLRQYGAESGVAHLLKTSAPFAAVWQGESAGDALAILDARFAPYAGPLPFGDIHLRTIPPFATTYGPSVYRCVCGESFGDRGAELTPEAVLALQKRRTDHFRAVYRGTPAGLYPGPGTLHVNLHRAVQSVVREQFPDAMHVTSEMLPAVAGYLREDGKGFLSSPQLEQDILSALHSYLELRRKGQPHPKGLLTIALKAEIERQLCGAPGEA